VSLDGQGCAIKTDQGIYFMSTPILDGADYNLTLSGSISSTSTSVTGLSSTALLAQGMGVICSLSPTGTLTIGTNTMTGVSTAGLATGMTVTGIGVPANTTIAAINSGAGTVTLSHNALATVGSIICWLIPIDTTIASINSATSITLSRAFSV
jgi:hypothetical protein